MQITIKRNDFNDLLSEGKSKWKLYEKQTRGKVIYALCYGIFIMLLSMMWRPGLNIWFWALLLGFGFSWVLYAVLYFRAIRKLKAKSFIDLKNFIDYANKSGYGAEVKISETGIIYRDFEIYFSRNWSNFSYYQFFENYIFLTIHNGPNVIAININEIASDQFLELSNFLKNTLTQKN